MLNKNAIKEVLDISLPAVGESTLYTFMSIFDTMMIGKYGGSIAVSVVGISNEILNTCVNIFIVVGISIGITSFVSRSIGAKEKSSAQEYASIGFFLGILISIFLCYILFKFSRNILFLAGAKGKILDLSNTFTKITVIAIFFNMITNVINSILRGYGNTYIPFLIAAFITIVKLFLDVILIFGIIVPELGIMGAAIASICSQAAGFIAVLIYFIKESHVKIKLRYIFGLKISKIRNILLLSIPSSMEDAAFGLSRLLCTFIIMHSGNTAFASNQIANTIESISFMPGMGFGVAATTLVGMKVGEKNYKKAREYTYLCAIGAVLMMGFFSAVFLIMPGILVNLFIDEEEKKIIYLASLCLFIGAFEQPSIAISTVFSSALKGAGDAKTPLIVSLMTSWIIRLPLIFYFIHFLRFSVIYVWWVTVIQWGVDAILMFILFEKKLNSRNKLLVSKFIRY
ncbi:MATE family efflux transporter [Clostridium scatologenes]|uniref:Probable multidrug resistance protein NorM n=1 Tax=Clostridium scatologenes TaxID=1548 RepID=A0A0E3JZN0_CLOSL|nr:MATE family efflux transporter [Clostridium scatologenes]AKA68470.1 MATE efflux family protein [Clostridium scatologenes]